MGCMSLGRGGRIPERSMSVVTVLGEIEDDALGITLPHEHLLLDLRNQYAEPSDPEKKRLGLRPVCPETVETVRRDPYALRDNLLLDDVELATAEVQRFHDAGGRTISVSHPGT